MSARPGAISPSPPVWIPKSTCKTPVWRCLCLSRIPLFIPPKPSTVSVFGAVYNQNDFIYRDGKDVGDYLGQAGGPTKDADKGNVYLVKADGSVVSRQQRGWLFNGFNGQVVVPGDAIVVPEELDKTTWTKDLKDWSQIFFQFALGAAALKVIKGL